MSAPILSSLDDVLLLITTSPLANAPQIAQALKNFVKKDKDGAELMLAGQLGSGQDPLTVLALPANTLGVLYILSARLNLTSAPLPVPYAFVQAFCRSFDPAQARLAPERVTMLANGLVRLADHSVGLRLAVTPLRDLIRQYPPNLHYLTTLHPIFLHTCVATRHFAHALPVLNVPITEIDKSVSDLTYHTSLNYHYIGGFCLTALKEYTQAEEFFEIAVATPAQGPPAALQLEALNKLALVQLILYGKVLPHPKHTHPALVRLFKASPYAALAKAFGGPPAALAALAEKEAKAFEADANGGLVRAALARAPRWHLRRLTETYATLSLAEIGRALALESEGDVRALVLSMIEQGEMHATLSAAGTVAFLDPPAGVRRESVQALLADAQAHARVLAEFDRELERSRDFLNKALKSGEHGGWMDDTDFLPGAGMHPRDAMWDEGDL